MFVNKVNLNVVFFVLSNQIMFFFTKEVVISGTKIRKKNDMYKFFRRKSKEKRVCACICGKKAVPLQAKWFVQIYIVRWRNGWSGTSRYVS